VSSRCLYGAGGSFCLNHALPGEAYCAGHHGWDVDGHRETSLPLWAQERLYTLRMALYHDRAQEERKP